jgi:hypothetical protein
VTWTTAFLLAAVAAGLGLLVLVSMAIVDRVTALRLAAKGK